VFRGRIVDLSVDRVRLPNGNVCDLELIRHPGAAAVVPVDGDGQVVLVRQYRYAAGGWLYEVPAGKLDPGESPEVCARRELEEETGIAAGKLTSLGWIWTTPGFTDERIWLFLATELTSARQALQADEVLSVHRLPFAEAVSLAQRGEIHDAKSICALLRSGCRLTPGEKNAAPEGAA
jgi:ADP-ribose pyrophosphatase